MIVDRRSCRGRAAALVAFALAGAALLPASARADPPPVFPELRAVSPKTPVIVVPGMTGSAMRDRDTKKVIWGTGARLFTPRDGGFALALSIRRDESEPTQVEAYELLEELRFVGLRRSVYGPIVKMLEANGYRRGDLGAPRAGDTVLPFAYDWRLSNARSAALLYRRLEGLRAVRGEERLEVDLLCHSNGAHICRYLRKYGGASLDDVDAGRAGPPETIAIRKLVFFGSAHGGSLRLLRTLNRGRSYIPMVGRWILPESGFGFPVIYQELTSYRKNVFLDAGGRELEIDLFDAENWRKYNIGIFNPEVQKRLRKDPRPELFGADEAERFEFLQRMLTNARRLQRALARDVTVNGTRYYSIQNVDTDTPDFAVLIEEDEAWQLLFTGDDELKKNPRLHELATVRGDRHASLPSQKALPPQEKAALARATCHVEGDHFELIFDPRTLECMAEYLAE